MEIFKIVAFAVVATVLVLVLKEQKKEISILLECIAAIGIMIYAISKMSGVVLMLDQLTSLSGINQDFLVVILKITGIAYIVEFGKNICMDAGQSAIATKLEMAGKVIVVVLSLPLMNSLISVLAGLV